ncbi:MAG: NHL repeat-containing protein [Candidatus Acidulodesulfobacterium sp.]
MNIIKKIVFLSIFLSIILNNSIASAINAGTYQKISAKNNPQIFIYKAIKNPSAIAVNSHDEIFIAGGDKNRYEIAVFNIKGKRLKTFIYGKDLKHQYKDKNKSVKAINEKAGKIYIYKNKGIIKPWSIFIGNKGNIWVANEGGKRGFISKISSDNGRVLLKITKQINFPYSIAFEKNGDILAANYGNGFDGYISEYNPDGLFLKKIVKGIENPYSIIIGNKGNIYAANYNKGDIVCLSNNGKLLWSSYKDISYPYTLLLGKKGNIWVINDGPVYGGLIEYSGNGEVIRKIYFGINYPYGAAEDRAGNIFVANFNNNTVSKFNKDGKFEGFAGSVKKPIGIAVDGKGDVFALNDDGNFTEITGAGDRANR